MPDTPTDLVFQLIQHPPFDRLSEEAIATLDGQVTQVSATAGQVIFSQGDTLPGLYMILSGAVDVVSGKTDLVSQRGPGEIMGERGLLRGGAAMLSTRATANTDLLLVSAAAFHTLVKTVPAFAEWLGIRPEGEERESPYATGLTALTVQDLMVSGLITCPVESSVSDVARLMRDHSVSSVLVMQDEALSGIVTVHDLTNKVLAEGLAGDLPVVQVMTANPYTIAPSSTGLDALMMLSDHRINQLPVAEHGRIVGIVGKTDLIRQQATTASHMVADIVHAGNPDEMAHVMERVPDLLLQLVNAGTRHTAVTRRITDLTDAITRRLLVLAEERLGPPPVPYLWLACGSQGRQEQTGVSDQDNCLILDDAFQPEHDTYFAELAQFVSDGLDTCGFVYCPGDMMATNPRWRQPRHVWRHYFTGWINEPDNEAQMLASVMFDLRPIAGEVALFDGLQTEVLDMARKNSIFVAHMVSNSLKHTPPLTLFRGFSLIRSGEHKNTLDLKLSGVVPVVDLGRVYALQGAFAGVNTRDRLDAAHDLKVISDTGARDLLDAYDLIAETRLAHQAAQIRAGGKPDNFMQPEDLSEFERNHLRDAFMVIKTMPGALVI